MFIGLRIGLPGTKGGETAAVAADASRQRLVSNGVMASEVGQYQYMALNVSVSGLGS